jgi:hypothetical protein
MIVTCGKHGQMQRDDARMWWTCAGFDGEGCPSRITDEEIRRQGADGMITV